MRTDFEAQVRTMTDISDEEVVIRPGSRWRPINVNELWRYRELLYFLSWRDVKVRYKQTWLGAAWAILQPVSMMVVFSLFFGRLGPDNTPYAVYVFAGLLPWQLFSYVLSESSQSVVANERLVTKVYFPRLIIPMSSACTALIDFSVSLILLFVIMAYYGVRPGVAVLALPLFVMLAVLSALSAGLWLGALNVKYRDVRYTLTFLIQLWFFATPVVYSASLVPTAWRTLYGLNPMAGVVEGFRWALLGKTASPTMMVGMSVCATFAVLVGGIYYFRSVEDSFADVV